MPAFHKQIWSGTKELVILCLSKLFSIREFYVIKRPEGEQHMVLSAPGLYVSVYNSVGVHPPSQKAAGDPVTCWFLSCYVLH